MLYMDLVYLAVALLLVAGIAAMVTGCDALSRGR